MDVIFKAAKGGGKAGNLMNFRTDLALEQREALGDQIPSGVSGEELSLGSVKINRIKVENEQGARALQKPVGNYITIEVPPFSDNAHEIDERMQALSRELARLLPKEGLILVVGLGNSEITPDALGPKTADKVLATRHITGEIARSAGLEGLRPVAVIAPGVLGQTGVETGEIIRGLADHIKPAGVIVVDALASRNLSRLGCTVQISDTGICPGSGVGNSRAEISKKTLGVPVIAVGVPTVYIIQERYCGSRREQITLHDHIENTYSVIFSTKYSVMNKFEYLVRNNCFALLPHMVFYIFSRNHKKILAFSSGL